MHYRHYYCQDTSRMGPGLNGRFSPLQTHPHQRKPERKKVSQKILKRHTLISVPPKAQFFINWPLTNIRNKYLTVVCIIDLCEFSKQRVQHIHPSVILPIYSLCEMELKEHKNQASNPTDRETMEYFDSGKACHLLKPYPLIRIHT